jgi:aspartate 1-decarboxylase
LYASATAVEEIQTQSVSLCSKLILLFQIENVEIWKDSETEKTNTFVIDAENENQMNLFRNRNSPHGAY